jgi:hypothetical protein
MALAYAPKSDPDAPHESLTEAVDMLWDGMAAAGAVAGELTPAPRPEDELEKENVGDGPKKDFVETPASSGNTNKTQNSKPMSE